MTVIMNNGVLAKFSVMHELSLQPREPGQPTQTRQKARLGKKNLISEKTQSQCGKPRRTHPRNCPQKKETAYSKNKPVSSAKKKDTESPIVLRKGTRTKTARPYLQSNEMMEKQKLSKYAKLI